MCCYHYCLQCEVPQDNTCLGLVFFFFNTSRTVYLNLLFVLGRVLMYSSSYVLKCKKKKEYKQKVKNNFRISKIINYLLGRKMYYTTTVRLLVRPEKPLVAFLMYRITLAECSKSNLSNFKPVSILINITG